MCSLSNISIRPFHNARSKPSVKLTREECRGRSNRGNSQIRGFDSSFVELQLTHWVYYELFRPTYQALRPRVETMCPYFLL
jgi:hypothetical protein